MRNFSRDLVYAFRLLKQAPGFALIAVLTLAIGIGANCAMFTLVDAVLLRPLPFARPDRLVRLYEKTPDHDKNAVSPLNFQDWSDQNSVFSMMAATSGASKTLITPTGADRIVGQTVTLRFFDLFGVPPIAGRTFTGDDAKQDSKAILISEGLWRNRFGGDLKLIGSTINFEGESFRVIGVMPAAFEVWQHADIWTLFRIKNTPDWRKSHYLRVFGRLKDGVTIDQARAGMVVVADNIARLWPATNKGWSITILPLHEATVGEELRTTSVVLAGVVGFVLLMACANVANLLLARGAARSREIAVRAALGGSQGRILQQLMTESAVLAGFGGAAGIALAAMIVRAAPAFLPADTLPPGVRLMLDVRMVLFSAAVTILTALVFGIVPAWQGARVSLTEALSAGSRSVAGGTGAMRSALAIAEIAAAVLLVAGAGLMIRTLTSLGTVDPGFRPDHVLTMHLSLNDTKYPKAPMTGAFYKAVVREVEALPGVRSAGMSTILPYDGWDIGQPFQIVDQPQRDPSHEKSANYQMITPHYFDAQGISLLAGRPFNEHDDAASTPVCIVNEEFVKEELAGRDPLGVRVRASGLGDTGPAPVVREIVGVIRQVKIDGPVTDPRTEEIYVPQAQNSWYWAALSVRTAGDPLAITQAVKAAIARVDKNQPVTRIRSMDEVVSESVAQPRFRAELVGTFAALALVLAAVGIFGVIAFSVSQRLREFGIRMALGATAADVLRLVLAGGLRITALGIGIGLGLSAWATKSIGSLLYGVKPVDPLTFLAAPALLGLVALIASAAPAIRAARVDPAVALRQE